MMKIIASIWLWTSYWVPFYNISQFVAPVKQKLTKIDNQILFELLIFLSHYEWTVQNKAVRGEAIMWGCLSFGPCLQVSVRGMSSQGGKTHRHTRTRIRVHQDWRTNRLPSSPVARYQAVQLFQPPSERAKHLSSFLNKPGPLEPGPVSVTHSSPRLTCWPLFYQLFHPWACSNRL